MSLASWVVVSHYRGCRHLLILREQITPFDIDFTVTEKSLDFRTTAGTAKPRCVAVQMSLLTATFYVFIRHQMHFPRFCRDQPPCSLSPSATRCCPCSLAVFPLWQRASWTPNGYVLALATPCCRCWVPTCAFRSSCQDLEASLKASCEAFFARVIGLAQPLLDFVTRASKHLATASQTPPLPDQDWASPGTHAVPLGQPASQFCSHVVVPCPPHCQPRCWTFAKLYALCSRPISLESDPPLRRICQTLIPSAFCSRLFRCVEGVRACVCVCVCVWWTWVSVHVSRSTLCSTRSEP